MFTWIYLSLLSVQAEKKTRSLVIAHGPDPVRAMASLCFLPLTSYSLLRVLHMILQMQSHGDCQCSPLGVIQDG
jgi:hypothetical protein